ncbi:MAG: VWA domain-containing protein, partial [Rhodospirillaceae bacterium]|nr:VWA domain-containing protein [Rhodospirillaceae bacterium]
MSSIAANVMRFARILRRVGLPIGTGKVALALEALAVLDIGQRDAVFAGLEAVFVERRAHRELFKLAFDRFWRGPVATLSMPETRTTPAEAKPAHRRIAE